MYSLKFSSRKPWSVATSLDWTDTTWRNCNPFCESESIVFAGFPEFELLSPTEQLSVAWEQHAVDISDVLYGEWAALSLTTQLLPLLENSAHRSMLITQIADESRHFDFFDRYLSLLPAPRALPASRLVTLLQTSSKRTDSNRKLLVCQLIFENLAMAWFRQIRSETQVPLLHSAIRLISRDEAAHLNIGNDILRARLDKLAERQKKAMCRFVTTTVMELSARASRYLPIGLHRNWDGKKLLQHLRKKENCKLNRGKEIYRRLNASLLKVGLGNSFLEPLLVRNKACTP